MKNLKNKVAVVTGAGSGIGRATAQLLGERGCRLAISDVNAGGLAETAERCRAAGVEVHTHEVDVSRRDEVYAWAELVARAMGGVNIVVNNAGVALSATVEDMSYEDFEWLMSINFWGVVYGTKAFLPHLRKAGEAHLVNMSSVFGLVGVPMQSAYNAAKFAVRGFTEALRHELELDGANIGVTTVHPGGIKTNIARSARFTPRPGTTPEKAARDFERMFTTSPERAAEDIVGAILNNRRRQLIGRDAVVIDLLQRFAPRTGEKMLLRNLMRAMRMPPAAKR